MVLSPYLESFISMPKTSIIIPTYQRPQQLRKAIESVLAQSFKDFELIVVDDASNDETEGVVRTFDDDRIIYMCHSSNRGGGAARNTGLKSAGGEYIAFLDDDDEWLPSKLAKQMEILEHSDPMVGGVYAGYFKVRYGTEEVMKVTVPTKRGNIYQELLSQNCIGSTSLVLLKKECFQEIGMFDESLPSFQDYDLWIRISQKFNFEYVGEPLLKYYVHEKKVWNSPENLRKGLDIIVEKFGNATWKQRKFYGKQYNGLGVMYCFQGDLQKGRLAFNRAWTFNPYDIRSYMNYGFSIFGKSGFQFFKGLIPKMRLSHGRGVIVGSGEK